MQLWVTTIQYEYAYLFKIKWSEHIDTQWNPQIYIYFILQQYLSFNVVLIGYSLKP